MRAGVSALQACAGVFEAQGAVSLRRTHATCHLLPMACAVRIDRVACPLRSQQS